MALTGQALPFDFPLPPRTLVYAPPPPSRSSLEVTDEIHHGATLKDFEDALNRAFPSEDNTSPRPQGATGRRRAQSSQPLGSPPLPLLEYTRSTQAQRKTTDGSFRPSPGEGLRPLRKPSAALESPDFLRYSARRVTGLRSALAPKHPRRDASLPVARRPSATKTPSSPPSPKFQKPSQRVAATPEATSFIATSNQTPRAAFLGPSELTVRPSTSPTTSDSTDSDATYIDSPLSSTFTSPKAALFRNSFTFESFTLDPSHGEGATGSSVAIDLGWDWSLASPSATDDCAPDAREPGSRPISPKTAQPLYTRFQRPKEKAARHGIPQVFLDVEAYREGNLPMTVKSAPLPATSAKQLNDLLSAFPAGEASALVEDLSRSGWYSSDDEDEDARGHGSRGANRKFSLSWGKGNLKKGLMRSAGFFRTGSTTSA